MAELDPRLERLWVVDEIRDNLTHQVGALAIHVTDDLDVIQVLSGIVSVPAEDSASKFNGFAVTLFALTTGDRIMADLAITDSVGRIFEFNLQQTEADLDALCGQSDAGRIAARDARARRQLKLVTFSAERSAGILDDILSFDMRLQERLNYLKQTT
jgi:hypothetical protein